MKPQEITEKQWSDKCAELSEGRTISECRDNVAYFAKHMLGVELYTWQKEIADRVSSGRKKVIVNCSRQIGKSLLVAIISLWALTFNKASSGEGRNTKIGIISRSDDQAKKIISEIRNLIIKGDAVMKGKADKRFVNRNYFSDMLDSSQKAENTKMSLTFKRGLRRSVYGSFVKSFPPTDAVLGNTFDFVFIDEASRVEDEIYYRAIVPTGDKYGAVWMLTSTPNGLSGFFYEIMDVEEMLRDHSWDRFWYPVHAVKFDDPEYYERKMNEIAVMLRQGKRNTVEQEYYGSFVASEQNFFDAKKVEEMFKDYPMVYQDRSRVVTLGLDVGGQKVSHTVVTVSGCEDGVVRRLFCKRYPVKGDGDLIDDLASLKLKFNIGRFVVEDCQIADFLIRDMERRGWNVYKFNPNSEKVPAYSNFRARLNDGLVESFVDDDLLVEMKALTKTEGKRNTMIHAPTGYTDDMVDSFVMSAYFYTTDDVGARVVNFDKLREAKKGERRSDEVSSVQRVLRRIRNRGKRR